MQLWLRLSVSVFGVFALNGLQAAPVEQAQSLQISGEEAVAPRQVYASQVNTGDVSAKEINWDALIPKDWQPEKLLEQYKVDEISDDDPRAQQFLDRLKVLWSEAPVVPALEGQRVKLPGFVVPLEMDAKEIDQFLLVPYFGACIHVPPPPSNQTVYVQVREGMGFKGELFDTVWVTGTMRIERLSSELAEAGYRLENATVTPYE